MSKLFGAFKASLFQPPNISIGLDSKRPVIQRTRKEKELYCANAEKTAVEIFSAKTEEELNRGADDLFSSLVTWCSDDEQDIRILADETLNKVCKVVQLNWPGRLLSLLTRQLVNASLPSRSLKAIMQKMSTVSHLIKPSKARLHVQNQVEILPALVDLNDDMVQEALGAMISKLSPALFYYASETELKTIIRLLLRPLLRSSAIQQRAAASAIAAVCQSARKPIITTTWILSGILRMLLPVDANEAETTSIGTNASSPNNDRQVGLMMGIKALLMNLSGLKIQDLHEAASYELTRSEQGVRHLLNSSLSSSSSGPKPVITGEHLIIIFELALHFCTNSSQVSLVTASLETLACLLQIRSKQFYNYLITPNCGKSSWLIYPDELNSVDELLGEVDDESQKLSVNETADDGVSISDLPTADGAMLSTAITSSASRLAVDRSDTHSQDSLTLLPVTGGSSLTSGVIVSESSGTRRSSTNSLGGTSAVIAGLTAELDEVERNVRQERLNASKVEENLSDSDIEEDSRSIITKKSGHSRTNTMTSAASVTMASPSITGDSSAYSNDASIGQLTDSGSIPLLFAVRLLSKRFLLSGYSGVLLSDRLSRISFKGQALNALAGMFSIYPPVVLNNLFPTEMVNQPLTDIFLYATHQDTHLKSSLLLLTGNFINSVLMLTHKRPHIWTQEHSDNLRVSHLVSIIESALNANSKDQHLLKSTVSAVGIFLPLLLQSSEALSGFNLLRQCITLGGMSYWLLKVELLEVISKLDLMIISHLDPCYCDVLNRILALCLNTLGDSDVRVRNAAGKALTNLIVSGNLPSYQDTVQDILLAKARCVVHPITGDIANIQPLSGSSSWLPCVFGLTSSFAVPFKIQSSQNIINTNAVDMLLKQVYMETFCRSDLNYTAGAVSFLLKLSEIYRPSLNLSSWSNIALPILKTIISLKSSTRYGVDLMNHAEMLKLSSYLLACVSVKEMKKVEMITYTKPREKWSYIIGKNAGEVKIIIEALLVHCLRLLNLFSLVFGTVANGNTNLLNLIRSPVRSITSSAQQAINRSRAAVDGAASASGTSIPPSSPAASMQAEFDRLFRGNTVGDCINLPHFNKIHKQLLKAFASYRLSSELCLVNEKFGQLLDAVLMLLSTILELSTLNEIKPILEELLAYLRSALLFRPSRVIEVVYQLLKALFGSSLVSHWDPRTMLGASTSQLLSSDLNSPRTGQCYDGDNRSSMMHGFYHACFLTPYTLHTQLLASMSTNMTASASQVFSSFNGSHVDDGYSLVDDLKMCIRRRSALIFEQRAAGGQPPTRADRELVESLIHPFEAVVIQSIRLYTLSSSDIDTQRAVLRLLTQLIYLRANYSLLDSNGAFMQCVIRQLDDLDHPTDLRRQLWLDDAFTFLSAVGLNPIGARQPPLSFSDLITLTDNIVANTLHLDKQIALPCLRRIVVDLFVCHSPRQSQQVSNDILAQMEVVILKLCKLAHPGVYPCLIVVLQNSRAQGEDRWKRVSRQISDILLPSLENRETQFSTRADFDSFVNLLSNLTASVFRPVDFIFRVFYRQPLAFNASSGITILSVASNMATVVGLTCVLLVHTKEDIMLARIREFFKEPVGLESPYATFANSKEPENAFISFQLDTIVDSIKFLVDKMTDLTMAKYTTVTAEFDFLAFLIAKSLLNILHIVHSGHFPRCVKSLKAYIESSQLDTVWAMFGITYPLPTLLWYQLIVLVSGGDKLPWNELCSSLSENSVSWSASFMLSTLLTLAADNLCERTDDVERLSWLLTCHSNTVLSLLSEATLRDLIVSCHRQSAASGLLVQAIVGALVKAADSISSSVSPHLMCRGLYALQQAHVDQQLVTLQLVIEKLLPTCRQWPQVKRRVADLIVHLCSDLKHSNIPIPEEYHEHWVQLTVSSLPPLISNRPSRALQDLFMARKKENENLLSLAPIDYFKEVVALPSSLYSASPVLTCNLVDVILSQPSSEWVLFVNECSNPAVFEQLLLSIVNHCKNLIFERMLMDGNSADSDLTNEIACSTQSILFSKGIDINTNCYARLVLSVAERCSILLKKVTEKFPLAVNDVVCIDRFPEDIEESGVYSIPSTANRTKILAIISFTESLQEEESESLNSLVSLSRVICMLLDLCSAEKHRHLIEEIKGFRESIWLTSFILVQYVRWHLSVVKCLPESDVLVACLKLACYVLASSQQWTGNFYWTQLVSLLGLLMRNSSCKLPIPDPYSSHARMVMNSCIQAFVNKEIVDSMTFSTEVFNLTRAFCYLLARLPHLYDYSLLHADIFNSLTTTSDNGSVDQLHLQDAMSPHMLFDPEVLSDFLQRLSFVGWANRLNFEENWSRLLGVVNEFIAESDHDRPREERVETAHCCCLAVRGLTALLCKTRCLAPRQPSQWILAAQNTCKASSSSQLTPLALLQSSSYRRYAVVRSRLNEQFDCTVSNSRSPAQLFCGYLERFELNSMDTEVLIRNSGMEQYASDDSDTASESCASSLMLTDSMIVDENLSVSADLDVNSCIQFLLDLYNRWLVASLRPPPAHRPPRSLVYECVSSLVLISNLFTSQAHWESMSSALFAAHSEFGMDDELLLPVLVVGFAKLAGVYHLQTQQINLVTSIVATCLSSKSNPVRTAGLHAAIYLMESRHHSLVKPIIEKVFAERQVLQLQQPTLRPSVSVIVNFAAAFYMLESFSNLVDTSTNQYIIQAIHSYLQSNAGSDGESVESFRFICRGTERLILTDSLPLQSVLTLASTVQNNLVNIADLQCWTSAIGLLFTCLYRLAATAQRPSSVSSTGVVNVQQQVADAARFANLERVTTFADKARSSAIDHNRMFSPQQLSKIAQSIGDVMFDLIAPADLLSRVIGDLSACPLPGPQLTFMASLVERVFSRLLSCGQRQTLYDWVLPSLTSLVQRQPLQMALLTQVALLVPLTEKPFLRHCIFPFLPCVYSISSVEQISEIRLPIPNSSASGGSVMQLSVLNILKLIVLDFMNQLNSGQRKLLLATYTSAASLDTLYNSFIDCIQANS